MTVWIEKLVESRRLVSTRHDVSKLADIAFFRQDGGLWFFATAIPPAEFDMLRPPVIWIDEGMRIDLANSKAIADLADSVGELPSYIGEKDFVISRVWPGQGKGKAIFADKLVTGVKLFVQIYLADYGVMKMGIDLDAPDLFRSLLNL